VKSLVAAELVVHRRADAGEGDGASVSQLVSGQWEIGTAAWPRASRRRCPWRCPEPWRRKQHAGAEGLAVEAGEVVEFCEGLDLAAARRRRWLERPSLVFSPDLEAVASPRQYRRTSSTVWAKAVSLMLCTETAPCSST